MRGTANQSVLQVANGGRYTGCKAMYAICAAEKEQTEANKLAQLQTQVRYQIDRRFAPAAARSRTFPDNYDSVV